MKPTENDLTTRIAFNRNRMAILIAGFGGAIFLLVTVLFAILQLGFVAPLIGLVVAASCCVVAWLRGANSVLKISDVHPASEVEHARLFNVAAGLCAAMGVNSPDLYVTEDAALNALATGRDDRHASLVFTQGLIDELSLIELEAVTSWLLYKVRSGDVGPETFAVSSVGAVGVLSEHYELPDVIDRILAFPMPLIERVLAWVHPSASELDTDLAAVGATRYPPALATAFEKIDGRSAITAASPVTEHLWIAPPLALSARRAVVHIHSRLPERIAVLQEL